jgi:hypothetical protein
MKRLIIDSLLLNIIYLGRIINTFDEEIVSGRGRCSWVSRNPNTSYRASLLRYKIGVLQQRVRRKHVVVRLHHGSGHLRSRSDSEGQLGLAALVHRQALQQERSKTGATATSSCVKDHESLKTSAVVSQLADAIQHINVYPSSRSSTDMYRQRRSTAAGAHKKWEQPLLRIRNTL